MSLGIVKQHLYPIVGIVLALLVGFAVYKVYSFGYDRAETKTTAKYESIISEINKKSAEELKKQIDEHNAFVERQNKLVNDLKADNQRLDRIMKENKSEAAKDPDAKRPALSKSSVMRLNRIR